jgi:hypothetical protein
MNPTSSRGVEIDFTKVFSSEVDIGSHHEGTSREEKPWFLHQGLKVQNGPTAAHLEGIN